MPNTKGEAIVYRTVDGIELVAQLYRPESKAADRGPAPFIIDAHGGAWGSGNRFNNAVIHEHLAAHGVGVFSLDFRLSSQARYPAPVDDVSYGVRWFKRNAASMNVQVSILGGLASSSGAQQMGLVALCPGDPVYTSVDSSVEGVDASLEFFIACWPILDPLARYRMVQAAGNDRLIAAHHAYFPDEAAMTSGNPFLLVDSARASHWPSMMILQGTGDNNVEHARADLFADRYRAAGGVIEVYKFKGEPHTFITADPNTKAAQDAIGKIRQFVLAQRV